MERAYKNLSSISRQALAVVFMALVLFGVHLGNRPVATRGEGRELLVVKSMLEQSNCILPLRNGGDIPSKPPMFHWLAAGTSAALGGLSEFSARFPSALSAALVLGVLFQFVAYYRNRTAAVLSVLVLVSAFEFSRSATHGRVDMCFTLGLTCALISLHRNLELWIDQDRYSWPWLTVLICSTAFAVLAKGPAAILIVTVVAGVYILGIAGDPPMETLKKFPLLPFAIAFALTIFFSGIWYWLAYVEHGEAFLVKHLWKENFTRLVHVAGETEARGHLKPFYFSFIHLFIGFAPWSFFLPVVVLAVWRMRGLLLEQENRFEFFLLVWIGVVLAAVTLSQSKRIVYLLPAYPALAALVGNSLVVDPDSTKATSLANRIVAVPLAVLSFVVLFVLGGALTVVVSDNVVHADAPKIPTELKSILAEGHRLIYDYWGFLVFLAAAAMLLLSSVHSSWHSRTKTAAYFLASGMLVSIFAYGQWIYPAIAATSDPRPIMSEVNKLVSTDKIELTSYRLELYPERFYTSIDIPKIESVEELDLKYPAYLILREEQLEELRHEAPEAEIVFYSRRNALKPGEELVLVRCGARKGGEDAETVE